jgi:hypothetical protein
LMKSRNVLVSIGLGYSLWLIERVAVAQTSRSACFAHVMHQKKIISV